MKIKSQLTKVTIGFILFLISSMYSSFVLSADGLAKRQQVMYFKAGVHRLAKIESSADYLSIKGDGSGVTILEIPGGISLTGKDPRLSGFTLVGSNNRRTGITLRNNYRALLQDIEIYGFQLGLLSTCDFGKRQWLHTYRDLYIYDGPDGHKSPYDSKISGVELKYNGDKESNSTWKEGGGFSNTHSFYGGRIAVSGTPLLIDGPSATKMFGTYIDMTEKPIRMTARSPGLQLFGVHLDRNKHARKIGIPIIILENPSFNRLKIFGQHTDPLRTKLILDAKGKPVSSKHVFLSPDRY